MFKKFKVLSKKSNRFYESKCAVASAFLLSCPMISSVVDASAVNAATGNSGLSGDQKWPWESFLNSLASELTGPLPKVLGILGIAVGAIGMFLGNHGSGMQKMMVLIFAVSICLFAPSFIQMLTSGATGAVIGG